MATPQLYSELIYGLKFQSEADPNPNPNLTLTLTLTLRQFGQRRRATRG